MLKQRLLTAAVLMPLFLAALFLMDEFYFSLFLLVILLLSLNEWATLSEIKSLSARLIYISAGIILVVGFQYLEIAGIEMFALVLLVWLTVVIRLFRFGKDTGESNSSAQSKAAGNGKLAWLDGYFVLFPTILGLEILKVQDPEVPQLLLVFFFIIWAADSGAYIAGRSMGKNKLAPRISPGKTIEGLVGGVVAALVVAGIVGIYIWDLSIQNLFFWLIAVIFITLLSVAGDLFESIYKRRAGLKDSGKLLPGHGGILDRIDSACAALPPYILVLYYLKLLSPGVV